MTIIIQHEIETPPGTVIDWLEKKQIAYQVVKLFEGQRLPTVDDFDLLVLCGGSMNVDQEAQWPWMKAEKELIQATLQTQKKLLGLCLGGQLMAEALGANVGPMGYSELGWQPMSILSQAQLGITEENLNVFQWHGYCFSEVPNTQLLAKNEAWGTQAFIYQNKALGFQFHPETSIEWAQECAADPKLPTGRYCQSATEIKSMMNEQAKLQNWFFKTLDLFWAGS